MEKKQLPVGTDNFEEIIEKDFYYVDKTNLISEMFENQSKVYLFTRPRRFGKSLNMSMLKYFFSIDADKSLFDGLKISENKKLCEKYQNKYPVISITLKSIQGDNYIFARNMFAFVVEQEARKFSFLLESEKLSQRDKESFQLLLSLSNLDDFNTCKSEQEAKEKINARIGQSLQIITQLLYKHYGVKPIVLIDEYDVPLAQALYNNYYDDMITLVRSFFDNGLKTNENIEFAVLTGCLRISRESIFTGMNNLKVFTVSQEKFSTCFGFTECEVKEMLKYYGRENRYEDAKSWYDGFNIGNNAMFSPWDVICFAQDIKTNETAKAESFWTETSTNEIIKTLLSKANQEVRKELETLVAGGTIEKNIVQSITYKDLYESLENIWSVMLSTGYLTIKGYTEKGIPILSIPNYEIKRVYIEKIQQWFKECISKDKNISEFHQLFYQGDAEKIEEMFNRYLTNTISLRDNMQQKDAKESFYHGILLGLLCTNAKSDYSVKSNQEAGDGYCDIYMEDLLNGIGAIVEVKVVHSGTAQQTCENALKQIEDKNYDEIFDPEFTTKVYKYAIACKNKRCKVRVSK